MPPIQYAVHVDGAVVTDEYAREWAASDEEPTRALGQAALRMFEKHLNEVEDGQLVLSAYPAVEAATRLKEASPDDLVTVVLWAT